MSGVLKVGPVSVAPGTKGFGKINIGERTDGSGIDLPIIALNGAKPGPRLGLWAGVHADEYNGVETIRRITSLVNPNDIRGSVVALPMANPTALEAKDRISHVDYKNLNRAFPGDREGSLTDRLAQKLFDEIIRKVDYLVDLHDGGATLVLDPVAMYFRMSGKIQEKCVELAKVFGTHLLWENSEERAAGGKNLKGLSLMEITKMGVPNITVEAGGGGVMNEESIEIMHRGVLNIMRHLGMANGELERPTEKQELILEGRWVSPTRGGILFPSVELGNRVTKGDVVARVTNLFWEDMERLVAPFDGIVFGRRCQPVVNSGDWAVLVGRT
jgi:predicted deacylase